VPIIRSNCNSGNFVEFVIVFQKFFETLEKALLKKQPKCDYYSKSQISKWILNSDSNLNSRFFLRFGISCLGFWVVSQNVCIKFFYFFNKCFHKFETKNFFEKHLKINKIAWIATRSNNWRKNLFFNIVRACTVPLQTWK
jgi:hypothetical protein